MRNEFSYIVFLLFITTWYKETDRMKHMEWWKRSTSIKLHFAAHLQNFAHIQSIVRYFVTKRIYIDDENYVPN